MTHLNHDQDPELEDDHRTAIYVESLDSMIRRREKQFPFRLSVNIIIAAVTALIIYTTHPFTNNVLYGTIAIWALVFFVYTTLDAVYDYYIAKDAAEYYVRGCSYMDISPMYDDIEEIWEIYKDAYPVISRFVTFPPNIGSL